MMMVVIVVSSTAKHNNELDKYSQNDEQKHFNREIRARGVALLFDRSVDSVLLMPSGDVCLKMVNDVMMTMTMAAVIATIFTAYHK